MKKYYSFKPISIKALVLLCFVLLSAQEIASQVRVPFQQRTSAVSPDRKIYNIKGDYTMIGNTNLTLVNYGDETSNANLMRYVDVDGDATTWNSSSATLSFASENGSVPECSNIIYAGLYWTGRSSDGPNSPDIFDYTRSVNSNVPINQNYTVGHQDDITNTSYDMQITRGGQTNNRYPIYSFSNGTDIYVFRYTNSTGADRVTLSINNGTPINVPVTVTGSTTLTATLATPFQIVDGNVILTINSLVRSSSVTLSTTNTEDTSFANVNVTGTIPSTTNETRTFDKRIVKIKGPNSSSYTEVTANFDPLTGTYDIYYPQSSDGYMYSAYAEITDYVKTNGLGSYTLADLALIEGDGGGTGYYGGWGIIVVYENSKMNWRDVTIFDGHSYVAGSVTADFEIPVSGFNTVQAGPVNMKLGLMCGEGDRGISGDYFQIRNHTDDSWITLNHSGNSATNFFNSSINTGGNVRNPNILNNTGLDISMFSIPNTSNSVITNNQTSTRFRYGSTQDTYVIFTVAMSVDAYIPEIPGVITTTQINNIPPSGSQPYSVLPGQEIQYSVNLYNTGSEASVNNVIAIPIPYGSTYVANSIAFNINFSPAPSVNNAYFDPLAGANGSIIWNISEIPLPADPTTLLGTITYKLRATTDCAILTNPTCNPSIITQGTTSGVGAISQVPFTQNFILGYTTAGACVNEPISGNLVTTIDAQNYITQNCQNTQTQYVFTYCNVSGSIPVSQISGAFPNGTTFYNEFPVTTNSIQYNSSTPFPGTIGTSTYYAVPPNSSGCFYIFDIVINNNLLVTQPANTGFNGCNLANITNVTTLPYSTSASTITINQFLAAGGTISNQSLINSISYYDVLSGTCPKIVTRNFKINTKCNDIPLINLVQTITITDNVPPVINSLPAVSTISCPANPQFAQATASDDCGLPVNLTFVDNTTFGNCADTYTVTRTWTATDACGNSSTASQVINVTDNNAPIFGDLPGITTINCPAVPQFTQAIANDSCSAVTLTFTDTTTPGQCAGSYTITRTWVAMDDCKNTSTVSQTIIVNDTTAPVIATLPAPSTISCPAVPQFAQATASDACGSTFTLTFNDVTTNGNCAGSYSVTRTWTATDTCGNSSTASQTINVIDNTAPVIATLPAPSTISCPAIPQFAEASASDACGSTFTLTFNDATTNGNCAGSYSVTRTWTATDTCGNTSTASQTINVIDNTAPVIAALPTPSTVSCPAVPQFAQATASDACGSTFTLTFNDVTTNGNCAGSYSVTRTWTATDTCGNTSTASQTINVIDNSAPVIAALPAPSTVSCPAVPQFDQATASDACGSTFTLTFNDVTTNGNCAGSYSVTRTWTATDGCGNSSTASQTINVIDNTAPVIATLPAPSTISCPAVPQFAQATASDACGSTFTLTFNDVTTNGNCAGSYSVTRTWTATDTCGNSSTASQTINVIDNTAPVIATLPAPSTISCPAIPQFAEASASDACGSTFTLTFNDVTTNGNCAGSYSVTRTWTATDTCGNTSTASQTINVIDNSAPVIAALPAPSTISCPAVPQFAQASASDACGSTFTLTFNDVTTNGNCAGSYSVTRTWTATDTCGNTSTASQTINVIDNSAPVIAALPAPSTVSCPAVPQFDQATASDACGSTFTLTFNDVTTNGNCAGSYSVTRTWTATDGCGNSSTASQTINVIDDTAPVIAALPAPSTVSCPAVPGFAQASASDACGSTFSLTFNDVTTNGNCAGSYSVTRTWTATDTCGNSSTASQTINVIDDTAPVIAALPAPSTISCPAIPQFAEASASDACGSTFTLTFNDITTNGNCAGSYSVTRTWTATDTCGNSSTASQTINVIDNTAPVIAALPAPSTVSCPAVPQFAQATASDACGSTFTLTFNDVTTNDNCAGSYSVTRTWTATDGCGNSSTASQTINVIDDTAPVITELPAPSTVNCPAVPEFTQATASDACGSTFTLTFNDVTTPGQCAGTYSVTRTWTATDACGNTSTASQTINVIDNSAPVIAALPAPSTVSCPAVPQFAQATASDACGSTFTLTFNDVTTNGNCAGSYSVTRTWTATDGCGNSSTASQTINVIDDTAPVIAALPAPSTISCPAVPQFAQATASDACGSTFTLTFNDVTTNGNCAGSYSVTRTWTATDGCGNSSTASQTINVIDDTAPVIAALPAPSTISCPATPEFAQATASDACGSTFTLTFNDVTTNGNCAGSYSVIRTWTAIDGCGNSSTASQTINVIDDTAPVIAALPASSTVNCPAVPEFAQATASDACGSTFTLTFNDVTTPGQCAGTYSVTRTWTATDACGNSSTASQTINVIDTTPPTITVDANDIIIQCNGQGNQTAINNWLNSNGGASATDTCSDVTWTNNFNTIGNDCSSSVLVTFTATDGCGNTATTSATLTINDTTPPTFNETLPTNTSAECTQIPNAPVLTASDNCGSATVAMVETTTPGQCAGSYTLVRTWTASDACQNTTVHVQTINVTDTVAPVIAELPTPSTVSCPAVPQFAQATASDACGSTFTLTFNDVTTNGNCAGSYSVTRTWTATDGCGNTSTASQTINVIDDTAPVIEALPAISTISCPAVPEFAQASASDACGSTFTLTFNDVTTNGNCAGSYSVTRTWTATDTCGNSSTASQTINVIDDTAPVITELPAPSTISCPATPEFDQATASDACGSTFTLTFNDVTTNGNCAGSYSVTRTWTAIDGCGNSSTASQTINVIDDTAPVIAELPAPSTISCPAVPQFAQATASDACGSTFTLTFNDVTTNGNCAGSYSITRTWTATDGCGNSSTASQTINVIDDTAPVIAELPAPSTVSCPAVPQFAQATASDACGSTFTLTFNDVTTNGNCAGSYSVTRTWTATDGCGNSSTASQTINVIDDTAPVIAELPSPSTVSCPAVPEFAQATASDACGSTFTLTFDDVTTPGQCTGSYSVTRTWTATNGCGNTSTATQTINVIDTEVPVIAELPAPSTINCPAMPEFAQATASDSCDTDVTLTFNDVTTPGQCAGSYSITRTWTATDDCGNSSTATQTINVIDTEVPVIAELPAPSTINCPTAPEFAQATATDTCDTDVALTFNDVTTSGQCAGSYSITRTWTATDDCGNSSTASQTINVIDTEVPVIAELPAPSTINCPAMPEFAQATASDSCDTDVTLTFNDVTTPGQCAGSYSITRTWTATDDCGNSSTATQTINVIDTEVPVIAELPAPSTINCPAMPEFAQATATDTCDTDVTLTFNDVTTPGQCAGSYSITRTWTATDDCGNSSTATQTINVIDTEVPVIAELPAPSTINCPAAPEFAQATATDTCDTDVTLTFNDVTTPGQCAGSYSITRTWTATDDCGNSSTASQTIIVIDTEVPVIAELPAPSTINCPVAPEFAQATATDTCDTDVTLTFNDVTTSGQCAGSYSITRTWTATDDCGNSSTASQTINVIDTTAPTLVGTLTETINVTCSEIPDVPQLTFTDECSSTNQITVVTSSTVSEVSESGTFTIIRTWTVTDACSNQAVFTQTLNVSITDYLQTGIVEDICNADLELSVNLSSQLSSLFPNVPTGGNWVDTDNTGALNGAIFSPYQIAVGNYDFTYEYGTASCPQKVIITVQVNDDCFPLPCEAIIVHNAFTPNGDGMNEFFFIENIEDSSCYSEISIEIFNRWGIKVFEGMNYDNDKIAFRGVSEGRATLNSSEQLPSGVYFYILKYKTSEGNYVSKESYLYLNR